MTRYEAMNTLEDYRDYILPEDIEAFNMAIKALEQVTFKDLKKPNNNLQGWIPCSERLPEAGRFRHYLITLLDEHSYMDDVYEAWYTERGWWLGEELLLDGAVIAWQPLPEPYKEQTERGE